MRKLTSLAILLLIVSIGYTQEYSYSNKNDFNQRFAVKGTTDWLNEELPQCYIEKFDKETGILLVHVESAVAVALCGNDRTFQYFYNIKFRITDKTFTMTIKDVDAGFDYPHLITRSIDIQLTELLMSYKEFSQTFKLEDE